MPKAERLVSYFPSFYGTRRRTTLLYELIGQLAGPLEECDTLLFRMQRTHRLKVAEHTGDILRLAAALNLTSFHFEDILNNAGLSYDDKLARMRSRVWRIAQVHLLGLGTPQAVVEAAAIFLDATLVPQQAGGALLQRLDPAGYSHVAAIEFSHLPDRPRERLFLHESPLIRRKEEPTARWPLASWPIENHSVEPSPVTLSIQGVDDRTVCPTIFCPNSAEGIVFNGVIPDGQTLLIDARNGARLAGTPVDSWVTHYRGGIFDFGRVESATTVIQESAVDPPFDEQFATAATEFEPHRNVPNAPSGHSTWYCDVARGVYDAAAFDYAVFDLPTEPIGTFDGDFAFDKCVFEYPPSVVAGMAWDERQGCTFKLLLPAHIPQPKGADPAASPNYLGRVGSILPRFKAAGVRAYVDSAHDAWVIGESILRSAAAAEGEGVAFHATRLRASGTDLYVDPETAP